MTQNDDSRNMKAKLPFVKLSAAANETHKRPIERAWEGRVYSVGEVEKWIKEGYGVGINIAGTRELAVIDIDETGETADAVASYFADASALVCVTASKGYHIFLSRKTFPHGDGKYLLKTPAGEVKVEWYRGSGARNIVLPIKGTPRERLGGRVLYCNKQKIDSAVDLQTMIQYLSFAAGVVVDNIEFDSEKEVSALRKIFGNSIKKLSREDVINVVRKAKNGERHNTLLRAGLVYRMRGWDLEELRQVGYEIFDGEVDAREEVDNIIEWVNKADVPVIEDVHDIVNRAVVGSSGKKIISFAEIIDLVFGDDIAWYAEGDDVYVLTNGYAICGADKLASYLAAHDIPISAERVKRFLLFIKNKYEHRHANILKPYPLQYRNIFACGVRVNNKIQALVAGGGKFGIVDPSELGLYIEWDARYRTLSNDDIENAGDLAKKLLEILSSFFVKSPHKMADIALLIAATVLSKSVVFLTGESGSGKTTLAQLMQYIINGYSATLSTDDKRDFSAVSASSRVLCFEEVNGLPKEFWNDIKIFTTLGTIVQRSLYTNKNTTVISSKNTFIFATTDISSTPGDVARRALLFTPSIRRIRGFREDEFAEALSIDAPRYIVAIMYLLKDFVSSTKDISIYDIIVNNNDAADLPAWLARANKADLTTGYYYMYRVLGVRDEEARACWEKARQGAALKGLGIWGDIIAKCEEDENVAKKMKEGAMTSHIADILEVDSRKIANKLSSSALKIVPVLEEMGWILKIEETKDSKYRSRKKYILYKDEDGGKGDNDGGDDGGGNDGGGGNNGGEDCPFLEENEKIENEKSSDMRYDKVQSVDDGKSKIDPSEFVHVDVNERRLKARITKNFNAWGLYNNISKRRISVIANNYLEVDSHTDEEGHEMVHFINRELAMWKVLVKKDLDYQKIAMSDIFRAAFDRYMILNKFKDDYFAMPLDENVQEWEVEDIILTREEALKIDNVIDRLGLYDVKSKGFERFIKYIDDEITDENKFVVFVFVVFTLAYMILFKQTDSPICSMNKMAYQVIQDLVNKGV